MKYTAHVRRMWEKTEEIRFMGYIKNSETGQIHESGIPRTSSVAAKNDAKKMIDELNGNI